MNHTLCYIFFRNYNELFITNYFLRIITLIKPFFYGTSAYFEQPDFEQDFDTNFDFRILDC